MQAVSLVKSMAAQTFQVFGNMALAQIKTPGLIRDNAISGH